MLEVRRDLVFELRTPDRSATCSIAIWVSSLDHEAFNDSMENQVTVVAIAGVGREILDSFGALLRV